MYALKTKKGQANLNVTDKNTYAVNLPVDVSREIFGKPRKRIALYLTADSNDSTAKALHHLNQIRVLIDRQDWQGLIEYEASLKPRVIKGNFAKETLLSLWTDYVKAKQDSWEASYLENDVKQATRILNQVPDIGLNEDLHPLINYLLENTTTKQTKRYLKQVSACLTWGVRRRVVKENPLPEFIKTLTTKKKNEEEFDINPFTLEERNLIIEAFRTGSLERFKGSHTRYADYVEFSFYTGARTSEILGLKWSHIDFERRVIKFQEAKVLATNGTANISVQKKGLKTQKKRDLPMNDRLYNLLKDRKERMNPSSLENNVFEDINHNSFRTGAYKYILNKLGIKYRKPYQTRHTFITILANQSDLKLHQIAQICGTSINVIEQHYLGTSVNINSLPEL